MVIIHEKLFHEVNAHLNNDMHPSLYFQSWTIGHVHPFTMLERLKQVPQSPVHHSEGNVWNHTMLVLDEAATQKTKASDIQTFMWAALLHDIGKAVTTKKRNGKITSYDHDKAGADLAKEFLHALQADEVFTTKVSALVRWHMQLLFVVNSMRFAEVSAMKAEVNTDDIALLGLCDRLGRGNANRHEEEKTVLTFLQKVDSKY